MLKIVLLFFGFIANAWATPCSDFKFSDPRSVSIKEKSVLISTHSSAYFEGRKATKVGVDHAVAWAKDNKVPVLYLKDDSDIKDYFFDDCNPDHWIYSAGGEFSIGEMDATHVYSIGGHWEQCQSGTLHDLLMIWKNKPKRDLKITVFMDAVYMRGNLAFNEADSYYNDYLKFMSVVTYGREKSEAIGNKITMIEANGVIIRENKKEEFLIRSLPHYERSLPDYRVEFKLNDNQTKVLQKGKGSKPPVLTFEFLDSALKLQQ